MGTANTINYKFGALWVGMTLMEEMLESSATVTAEEFYDKNVKNLPWVRIQLVDTVPITLSEFKPSDYKRVWVDKSTLDLDSIVSWVEYINNLPTRTTPSLGVANIFLPNASNVANYVVYRLAGVRNELSGEEYHDYKN